MDYVIIVAGGKGLRMGVEVPKQFLPVGGLGILRGKRATCYPGFEQTLEGATYTAELCTVDGNVTTGEGPAAAFPFAYALLAQLTSEDTARQIAVGMRYAHLMER